MLMCLGVIGALDSVSLTKDHSYNIQFLFTVPKKMALKKPKQKAKAGEGEGVRFLQAIFFHLISFLSCFIKHNLQHIWSQNFQKTIAQSRSKIHHYCCSHH